MTERQARSLGLSVVGAPDEHNQLFNSSVGQVIHDTIEDTLGDEFLKSQGERNPYPLPRLRPIRLVA